MNKKYAAIVALLFFAVGLAAQNAPGKYEMRAGWMASVANISWPAKKGLSNEELKAGYIQFLDSLVAVRANAVIMQVRPTGDSFYPMSQEPWSIYLTGVQGKAPAPLWDPMEFLIREAHKRGLEFHAWMNPYRVAQHNDSTLIAENHAMREHPEWFVQYGKQWYFDPGVPESADYTVKMVEEYAEKYNLDRACIWLVYTIGLSDEIRADVEAAAKACGFEKLQWIQAGGVITTHAGPAAFGFAGLSKK